MLGSSPRSLRNRWPSSGRVCPESDARQLFAGSSLQLLCNTERKKNIQVLNKKYDTFFCYLLEGHRKSMYNYNVRVTASPITKIFF